MLHEQYVFRLRNTSCYNPLHNPLWVARGRGSSPVSMARRARAPSRQASNDCVDRFAHVVKTKARRVRQHRSVTNPWKTAGKYPVAMGVAMASALDLTTLWHMVLWLPACRSIPHVLGPFILGFHRPISLLVSQASLSLLLLSR